MTIDPSHRRITRKWFERHSIEPLLAIYEYSIYTVGHHYKPFYDQRRFSTLHLNNKKILIAVWNGPIRLHMVEDLIPKAYSARTFIEHNRFNSWGQLDDSPMKIKDSQEIHTDLMARSQRPLLPDLPMNANHENDGLANARELAKQAVNLPRGPRLHP